MELQCVTHHRVAQLSVNDDDAQVLLCTSPNPSPNPNHHTRPFDLDAKVARTNIQTARRKMNKTFFFKTKFFPHVVLDSNTDDVLEALTGERTAGIAGDQTETTVITYNFEITGSEGAEKVSGRENEKLVACISSREKHLSERRVCGICKYSQYRDPVWRLLINDGSDER